MPDRNIAAHPLDCLIPIIHSLEVRDDRFSMSLAFNDRCRLPRSPALYEPAPVVEDRLTRLGIREHFDPALYTKQAGNAAQNYRLLQFFYQFAAWALRCDFNNEATRSDGCAPRLIQ